MKTPRPLLCLGWLLGWISAIAVTLEWDPSPDAWVAGYRLHWGNASSNYIASVDVGTNTTCTLTNLQPGRYYFVATAYTADGQESLPSNEVAWSVPSPPMNARTVIVQWTGAVATTNWQDVGFFRIRIGE